MPVHSMSTILLPQSILNRLDQLSRTFLWGSTAEKKKQHLVKWSKVCSPKKEGGLGVRAAKSMNRALISKVGWRLLQEKNSLWTLVLQKKYHVGEIRDSRWLIPKGSWSSTWRSIAIGLRDVVSHGVGWIPGDGQQIRFWTDRWVSGKPLLELDNGERPTDCDTVVAKDLWIPGRGWDFAKIDPYTTNNTRLELRAVVLDLVTGARDRLSWKFSQDGQFSVRSAYEMLTVDEVPRPNMASFFNCLWKVRVPERVKTFLWLVGNQAVMTEEERHRRHLSASNVCQVCKGGVESMLHVLRDCPAQLGIWVRVVPQRRQQGFFSKSLFEWLYDNLGDRSGCEDIPWSTIFAVIIWWGWKWRCGNIFGENTKCRDRVKFVKEWAVEVYRAHSGNVLVGITQPRVERMIGWVSPCVGWVKVNTDGASRGNPGLASAGGVLRDCTGAWCGGFSLNIGRCSAPQAELWGVYYGLYFAWEKKVPRVELEVDSEVIVGFLKTGISDSHPLSFLVRLCHGFLQKDWLVRIVHVYREANRLADGLANYAFSLSLGFHSFDLVPDAMSSLLREDTLGSTRPRRVRL